MSSDVLDGLLVPVVTAVVGAVGILLRDLYDRRSEIGRRKYAMDDATRQVTFAAEWWKAKQALGCTVGWRVDAATGKASDMVRRYGCCLDPVRPKCLRNIARQRD